MSESEAHQRCITYIPLPEVARLVGRSESWVKSHVRRGTITPERLNRKRRFAFGYTIVEVNKLREVIDLLGGSIGPERTVDHA